MDNKILKLLDKSANNRAAAPVSEQMCGEIAHTLRESANCLIAAPPGSERISIAVGIIRQMPAACGPVWYLSPSEMPAIHQKFHLSSALGGGDAGVSLNALSQREGPGNRVVIWSAEMLMNAMADLEERTKPALLVVDHGDLLNHPRFGALLETILLNLYLDVPLLVFTSPTDRPEELTQYLTRCRGRACRSSAYGERGRALIPAFLPADWELTLLTDKRRLANKVKRIIKTAEGLETIRFPELINRLAALLRTEHLLPALVLLPSERLCDQAAECCQPVREAAGAILTTASVSAILETHPTLKEDPRLSSALSTAAAAFHTGHSHLWLQLVGKLLALEGIDLLFATPDSAADLDFRMGAAVLCMPAEGNAQRPPAPAAWQIERVKGLLGRERAGLFVVAHTPDCDPARVKDHLTDHRVSVRSDFRPNSRIVLGLLCSDDRKTPFPGRVNCSLFAAQNPPDLNFADRYSPGGDISFEVLDADLKEQLPEARCAAYLQCVYDLMKLRTDLSIRSAQISRRKWGDPEAEAASLERIISRFPCEGCPHFSLCHKRGSKRFRAVIAHYEEMQARRIRDIEALRTDLCRHLECVRAFGFADAENRLTPAGRFALCTGLDYPQALVACFRQSLLSLLDPDILFALVGGLCPEAGDAAIPVAAEMMPFYRQIEKAYQHMAPTLEEVQERMLRFGILPPEYALSLAAVLLARRKGEDGNRPARPTGFSTGRLERAAHRSAYLVELLRSRSRWLDNR